MKKNKNGIITAIIVYLGLILGIFVLVGGSTSQRNPQDTNRVLRKNGRGIVKISRKHDKK